MKVLSEMAELNGPASHRQLALLVGRPDLSRGCQGWRNAAPTAAGRALAQRRSRSLSCIAGLLSRPVCRPGAVLQRLGPLGSIHERLCVDRGSSWAPIARAFTFEDRQCRLARTPPRSRRLLGVRTG